MKWVQSEGAVWATERRGDDLRHVRTGSKTSGKQPVCNARSWHRICPAYGPAAFGERIGEMIVAGLQLK